MVYQTYILIISFKLDNNLKNQVWKIKICYPWFIVSLFKVEILIYLVYQNTRSQIPGKLFDILGIFKLYHSIYQVYQEYIATGFYEHQAIVETNSYMSHEKTLWGNLINSPKYKFTQKPKKFSFKQSNAEDLKITKKSFQVIICILFGTSL